MVFLMPGCTSIFTRTEEEQAQISAKVSTEVVPERGGDMFIAVPESLSELDPLEATSEDLENFYGLLFDTPFYYDETGRLQNDLVDHWTVSTDGRVFNFYFRDNVFFSDGTALAIQDVYESAQRALSRLTSTHASEEPASEESPDSETSAGTPLGSGLGRASSDSAVSDISIAGDGSLEVTASSPGNAVLHFMTFPVTKASFGAGTTAGTGPYYVAEQDSSGQLVLEINPYRTAQDVPYIERIVAKPVPDQSDKVEMQQTSLVDVVTTSALNAGNYNIDGKSRVIDYMTNYFDCLVPNLSRASTGNPLVRRAISDAIDRRVLLSTVLLNHGVPTILPVAPDSFLMDQRFRSNQRDEEAALELLGEAGYRTSAEGAGQTLRLNLIVPDTLENSYRKDAARAISKQLAEVFVEVEVEELSASDYLRRLRAGDFDLAYCSYYLDDAPKLGFMVGSNGSGNYSGYTASEVDRALAAYDLAITEEEMVSAYATLQELLERDLPVIGLYFRMNSLILDEGIGGISGIREGRLFVEIGDWYTTSRSVPAASASPSPEPTVRRQTEPDVSVTSPTPSKSGSS